MKLVLSNGYPYPFTAEHHLHAEREPDFYGSEAAGVGLMLEGVKEFQQLHTVTVSFENQAAFDAARAKTGWHQWGELVLECPTSLAEGYGFAPAYIARHVYNLTDKAPTSSHTAFCNLILTGD